jgi:Holliday junction resolvase RusA-like endonuclease
MTVTPIEQARTVTIDVRGVPHPQGSMRLHSLPNGKTAARYPAAVYAWRAQVQQAVAQLEEPPLGGAVELRLGFDLARPQDHFLPVNSRRSAPELRPSAPAWPINILSGDIDKYTRSVCDSITDAGLWKDDSQVVTVTAAKRYCPPGKSPGVHIVITELL